MLCPNNFFQNSFLHRSETENICDKIKNSVRPEKSIQKKSFGKTDENCANEIKIRLTRKNSPIFARFLPPIFFTKKHVSLSNFRDTLLFFLVIWYEKLAIRWKKKDPSKTENKWGQESTETEHQKRKIPGNFQWDVIPRETVPYASYFMYLLAYCWIRHKKTPICKLL